MAQAAFRSFNLAFIQLGKIGADKAENLKHACDMIRTAASGQGQNKKPDLIVLPVRLLPVSRCTFLLVMPGIFHYATRGCTLDTYPC